MKMNVKLIRHETGKKKIQKQKRNTVHAIATCKQQSQTVYGGNHSHELQRMQSILEIPSIVLNSL